MDDEHNDGVAIREDIGAESIREDIGAESDDQKSPNDTKDQGVTHSMILTHRGPADWFGHIRAQMMDSNSHKRKQDLELTQRDSNSHKRSLVDCWTSQVNAAGEHIASSGVY
jgi:hypothetical protein